jgi:hypothetical protein
VRKSLIAATSMLVINLRAQEKHVLFAVENFLFFFAICHGRAHCHCFNLSS